MMMTSRELSCFIFGFILCLMTFHVFNAWQVWERPVVPAFCRRLTQDELLFRPEKIIDSSVDEVKSPDYNLNRLTVLSEGKAITATVRAPKEPEPIREPTLPPIEPAEVVTTTSSMDYNATTEFIDVREEDLEDAEMAAPPPAAVQIAIGLTTTSKKTYGIFSSNIKAKFVFFKTLLPSFCKTCSVGDKYVYTFYISYDEDDKFFKLGSKRYLFEQTFQSIVDSTCRKWTHKYVSLKLIGLTYSTKPAWAQNDVMIDAYLDNHDYYYRLNDDVTMTTPNWTESFISALANYNPPNVGMVSPNHTGGHSDHFEFDFVHYTHLEIFGFYYPRVFLDLYADEWMGNVYVPGVRASKIPDMRLLHTQEMGKRYNENKKGGGAVRQRYRDRELDRDKKTLQRYLTLMKDQVNKVKMSSNSTRIIAMSLVGVNISDTLGALWNFNLAKVLFPGWKVRFYISNPDTKDHLTVPQRILAKLRIQGAQFVQVTPEMAATIPHQLWKYLAIDDGDLDLVLFRDPASRLSDADTLMVKEITGVYHVYDACTAFYQTTQRAIDNQMGMKAKRVRARLTAGNMTSMADEMLKFVRQVWQEQTGLSPADIVSRFLRERIWPLISGGTRQYAGLKLDKAIPAQKSVPRRLKPYSHVGWKHDAYDTLPSYLHMSHFREARRTRRTVAKKSQKSSGTQTIR